jgi:hypothetical protein
MNALLVKYDIEKPANLGTGVYVNSELQAIYDELLASATTLEGALKAGQTVEKTDIENIKVGSENTPEDMKAVYDKMLEGSERHLDAFNRALEGDMDGDYDGEHFEDNENGYRGGENGNRDNMEKGHSSEMEQDRRDEMQKEHGLRLDNGHEVKTIEAQEVNAQFLAGWEMISIPVVTEVEVASLLPKEADGSIIFVYDNANQQWEYTKVTYDEENNKMVQDSDLTIKPLQGFWIHSPEGFTLDANVPTTVTTSTIDTSETPPAPAVVE